MLHVPTDLARHAIEIRGKPSQMPWSLSDIWDVIRWRQSLILFATAAVLAAALIYVAVAPPKFTATTVLMTDTKRSPAFGSGGTPDTSVDMVVVESQIETLKSDKIALAVIDKLGLSKDPEFTESRPTPWSFIARLFSGGSGKRPRTDDIKRQIAAGNFKRGLEVERAGRSYIAQITFTSANPEKAAAIANAIAEAYIVDQLSAKLQIAQRSSDWVENRVAELRQRAMDATKALTEFKATNDIPGTADNPDGGFSQPVLGRRLRELEAAAQSAKTTYETFLSRYTQSMQMQQQAFPVTEARVLAEASPPLSKSAPKTILILVLAIVAGGTLGLIAAFAREFAERLVRSPRQLEQELRVRVLGTIPRIKRSLLSRGGQLHLVEPQKSSSLGTVRPITLAGESLRGIKVALDRSTSGQGHVIGISSPRRGTGKTTLAYNLALLAAQAGRQTLLVDADLRHSTLARSLTSKHQPGLVTLVAGQADMADCIVEHRPLLHVIGETSGSGAMHPSEILGSTAMVAAVDRLRKTYDYIIIDLPPLLDCVDVRACAPAIALFILVTEWGRTPVEDLDRALASCDVVVERLLGVAINKVAPAEFGRRH
jgi:succinoglycan biosynthesis transport protein ExoP